MQKPILLFIATLFANLSLPLLTRAQITQVADICPGTCSSNLAYPALLNGKAYFQAYSTTSGVEVWQYDGTSAPSLLYDIVAGAGSSFPSDLFVYHSKLYFTANDSHELWSYDGTNTPSLVKNFGTAYISTAVFLDKIYILAGNNVWSYDGTTATNIADFSLLSISPNAFLGSTSNALYFNATSATYGSEIWRYNGSGLPAVLDIYSGSSSGITSSSFVVNGANFYFSATDGTHGTELWVDNGTGSPSMVYDIDPGAGDGAPGYGKMALLNGKIYFSGHTTANGTEIWSYDGTNTPTLLSDINPGASGSNPTWITAIGTELFLSADDGTHGSELWKYNGSTVSLVKDVAAGTLDFNPQHIFGFNSKVYMRGSGDGDDSEFWVYNPLATGVELAEAENNSRLYPNPLRTNELPKINSAETLTSVRVTTLVGDEVYQGANLQAINKPGVYFVELEQNGKRSIQRIVVQ